MTGKFANAVGILATATLLASGGFVGFLFASGRLSHARLATIAAVLRGELDEGRSTARRDKEPAATQPVAERTADDVQTQRQREYLESLRIERGLADLEAQRRLLDQAMQAIVLEQERLAKEKAAVTAQKKEKTETALDEGFKKEVEYVSGLSPRQAKEHIIRVWRKQQADAVRLFLELDVGRGKRILDQFKTPEELEILTSLLEQMRSQGSAKFSASG